MTVRLDVTPQLELAPRRGRPVVPLVGHEVLWKRL